MAQPSTEVENRPKSTIRTNQASRDRLNIELEAFPTSAEEYHLNVSSLPPVDTGKDAWLFLAAAFMVETLVWGFPFAYGIFQVSHS